MNIYSRVRFPQMRQILLFSLKDLSDNKLQLQEWVSKTAKHRFWDTMRFDINVIYYDLGFEMDEDEKAEDKIGYSLVDESECRAMEPVVKALDDVYDIIGPEQPDSAYIDSPLWDEVVRASGAALKVFLANEAKAKAKTTRYWQNEDDWHLVPY